MEPQAGGSGLQRHLRAGRLQGAFKLCLITRREKEGIAYYTQIGTGNYNEKTARLYTDLCLMTANRAIGEEANAVFNALAKGETVHETRHLLVAPLCKTRCWR